MAKESHIFPAKITVYFVIFTFENLTECLLMMSLVWNNRSQETKSAKQSKAGEMLHLNFIECYMISILVFYA